MRVAKATREGKRARKVCDYFSVSEDFQIALVCVHDDVEVFITTKFLDK
jgi:hypothetical protein